MSCFGVVWCDVLCSKDGQSRATSQLGKARFVKEKKRKVNDAKCDLSVVSCWLSVAKRHARMSANAQ